MDNASFKKDDLTKKILDKAGMEQPSYSFTSRIMEQIRLSRSPEVFMYKPVISKRTWILLGFTVITALFLFSLLPASQSSYVSGYAKYLDPAQHVVETAASGFFEKMTALYSFSWMAFALVAGWLLISADKFLRRLQNGKQV